MARFSSAAFVILACVVVTIALAQGATARVFLVGEGWGWGVPPNGNVMFYVDWAQSHAPFASTDALEFRWGIGDSVVQVPSDGFYRCSVERTIAGWAAARHVVYPLQGYQNQRMYFISGDHGHCNAGQRFFIDVNTPA